MWRAPPCGPSREVFPRTRQRRPGLGTGVSPPTPGQIHLTFPPEGSGPPQTHPSRLIPLSGIKTVRQFFGPGPGRRCLVTITVPPGHCLLPQVAATPEIIALHSAHSPHPTPPHAYFDSKLPSAEKFYPSLHIQTHPAAKVTWQR